MEPDPAPPLPTEDPQNRSTTGLRIFGDDLDPVEITDLLGCEPTRFYRRGDTETMITGRVLTRKTGMWSLQTRDGHGDFNAQIGTILSLLTDDLSIWRDLSGRYDMDVFCGFFMGSSNTMLGLEVSTMTALSCRNIKFTVDLYDPGDEK